MRKIAIFRALQLGDLLVSVPVLRAIRQHFPEAEITLIGLSWAATFVERYSRYLDRFVEFVGYPGIPEVPNDALCTERFLQEQRAYGYDLVIQMHGSGNTSNPFALALRGAVTAGYYEQVPFPGLDLSLPYPQDQPEILRNLALASLVGCRNLDPHLEFPLYEEDDRELAAVFDQSSSTRRLKIGIHPGSRPPARRWPAEYFAFVADELAQHFDAQIIFTGSKDEVPIVQEVQAQMKTQALHLVGKTSLGSLGLLLSRLDLFISNDTGPAHMACAFPSPSITLFGPADYYRWAPLEKALHAGVRHPVACSPCGFWTCPIDHRCLRRLTPERVLALAMQYLDPGSNPRRVQQSALHL